jgi:hypothetical protein
MVGAQSKRKLLHYRKAQFLKPIGRTLQECLEDAIVRQTPVKLRFRDLATDPEDQDGWKQFINTHRSALGMEFGNVVLYAPDQNKQVLAIDENADELDIQQISPPPGRDGTKNQFLESILYYGVRGNHVLVLQSMAMRARDLEGYLNWLLRGAGIFDDSNAVFLNNYAPTLTRDTLERSEVKSVRIGTALTDAAVAELPNKDVTRTKFRAFGEGIEVLRTLMPERMKDLTWSDITASTNLEVFVEVTYKRQTDDSSQATLNKIASALRHVSDDDIRIELKGGTTIVGSQLQVKNYVNVDTFGGVVDPFDLFSKMSDWLVQLLEDGVVEA